MIASSFSFYFLTWFLLTTKKKNLRIVIKLGNCQTVMKNFVICNEQISMLPLPKLTTFLIRKAIAVGSCFWCPIFTKTERKQISLSGRVNGVSEVTVQAWLLQPKGKSCALIKVHISERDHPPPNHQLSFLPQLYCCRTLFLWC